jgi:asparagine synthase (glutamine-hydrolysing)
LLLARDRFGIKPLYYARLDIGLVFASELKALLALPGVSRSPDPDVISAFALVGYNVFPGRTPFEGIRAVQPGHAVELDPDGSFREWAFASLPDVPEDGSGVRPGPEELAAAVGELLAASVRRSMCHDPNPKALFFSGGIDSTLLLALGAAEGSLQPFVLSDRSDADDLIEARHITRALGMPLVEQRIDHRDLAREIVHYAWYFEHPIAGGAFDLLGGVAFHALARRIGSEFRVALCGEGADELFLGYHRLHMEPSLTIESLAGSSALASPALAEWLSCEGLLQSSSEATRAIRRLALAQGLSEYHLPSVDRSGMAFGLEVRPPYLDNELSDFVIPLDDSVLIDRTDCWTKLPLRAIARRLLSGSGTERVAVRRKRAMPSAVERAAYELVECLELSSDDGAGLARLLMDLFIYLHIDPGMTTPPDFDLVEFAAEHSGNENLP